MRSNLWVLQIGIKSQGYREPDFVMSDLEDSTVTYTAVSSPFEGSAITELCAWLEGARAGTTFTRVCSDRGDDDDDDDESSNDDEDNDDDVDEDKDEDEEHLTPADSVP
ncbi:hypothetical protein Tco_0120480 [Tanacetum coccineum]